MAKIAATTAALKNIALRFIDLILKTFHRNGIILSDACVVCKYAPFPGLVSGDQFARFAVSKRDGTFYKGCR
jgi:hypothetical protein